MKLACLPLALLLANCNAPTPPAPATTVIERVVERPQVVVAPPAVTIEVPTGHHDEDQRRREEEQRHRDEHDRPH